MFIEMFGDTVTKRQASQTMNTKRVKEIYDYWLSHGKDKNKALLYVMGKSEGKYE